MIVVRQGVFGHPKPTILDALDDLNPRVERIRYRLDHDLLRSHRVHEVANEIAKVALSGCQGLASRLCTIMGFHFCSSSIAVALSLSRVS